MKFPNAAKGVKKIYVAEVLTFISLLMILVVGVFAVIRIPTVMQESAIGDFAVIGGMILLLASAVLLIVAFIINLVGMINASRDESSFKSALIFFIVSIVLTVVSSLLGRVSVIAGGIVSLISSLVSILVTIFIIAGIVRLADRLNRGDTSAKGSKVLKLLVVLKLVAFIATVVATVMDGFSTPLSYAVVESIASGKYDSGSLVPFIIFIAVQALELIQYFIYLPFLSQAKKMLNKA